MYQENSQTPTTSQKKSLVLGGGCFWCIEALMQTIQGVLFVQSGYSNLPYCQGSQNTVTSKVEAVQIIYDPDLISFQTLIGIFFQTHDSTALKAKPLYQSVILCTSEQQCEQTQKHIKEIQKSGQYQGSPGKILTKVDRLQKFNPAQQKHQNYYAKDPNKSYCQTVISPKLTQFRKKFSSIAK